MIYSQSFEQPDKMRKMAHHCSVTQIGSALVEMQKNVDALQKTMRALKHVTVSMECQTESSVTL